MSIEARLKYTGPFWNHRLGETIDGFARNRATAVYFVEITEDAITPNTAPTLAQEQTVFGQATGIPRLGADHPDDLLASTTKVRAIDVARVSPLKATVTVTYIGDDIGFRFPYRIVSRSRGDTYEFDFPYWELRAADGPPGPGGVAPGVWVKGVRVGERVKTTLWKEVRGQSLNAADVNDITSNLGYGYTFNGIPYVLTAFDGYEDNRGETIIRYVFTTVGPINVGRTSTSTKIYPPNLDFLEQYLVVGDSSPPEIEVVTAGQQYEEGVTPLPGL